LSLPEPLGINAKRVRDRGPILSQRQCFAQIPARWSPPAVPEIRAPQFLPFALERGKILEARRFNDRNAQP
jgi:hypothetical protein